MRRLLTKAILALSLIAGPALSEEMGIDDSSRSGYYNSLKGKQVVFVPVALGFDLTDGWYAGMKANLEPLGMDVQVRDPNWSADAGARAISSLIGEKPDLIVVHNPDVQTYAKLLKKAEKNEIHVVQINMKSSYSTDAYVGADYIEIGELAAQAVVEQCGPDTSGEIAIVQGVLTAAASAYQLRGVSNVLSKHPEIKIVSNQAADWDSTKARAITETTLLQNPNLCGIIGFWDGMDVGIGAAINESSRANEIFVVTSGGGGKASCDNLEKGFFDLIISYDVPGQARDLSNAVKSLLQTDYASGSNNYLWYTKLQLLTKDNLSKHRGSGACWTVKSISSN